MQSQNIPLEQAGQLCAYRNSLVEINQIIESHLQVYKDFYNHRERFNFILNKKYDATYGHLLYSLYYTKQAADDLAFNIQEYGKDNEFINICQSSDQKQEIQEEMDVINPESNEHFYTQENQKLTPKDINNFQNFQHYSPRFQLKKEDVQMQKTRSESSEYSPERDEFDYENQKLPIKGKKKIYKRGPYTRFTEQQKLYAIQEVRLQKGNITKVSKNLNIPAKNLKRWIEVGPKRKEGGGRKTLDPLMEEKLIKFIRQQYYDNDYKLVNRRLIRRKALEFSCYQDKFKASKGWLEKFINRHQVQDLIQRVENSPFSHGKTEGERTEGDRTEGDRTVGTIQSLQTLEKLEIDDSEERSDSSEYSSQMDIVDQYIQKEPEKWQLKKEN